MKVLLLGEYSGVFTELKKALEKKGVHCYTMNDGDGWKGFPADYRFPKQEKKSKSRIALLFHELIYRLGFKGLIGFYKNWKTLKQNLAGYDVVQLINPIVYGEWGAFAHIVMYNYIFKHNGAVCLSVLGDDYYTVKWARKNIKKSNNYQYSIRDVIWHPSATFMYEFCLGYHLLNFIVARNSKAIIPGVLNYKEPYDWTHKVSNVIPFPIDEKRISKQALYINGNDKVKIFHGWQKGRERFKGNDVFDSVIRKLIESYPEKVDYLVVQNVPYDRYIKLYEDSHIYIDQLYGVDKGVNATLGMAAGKVVFTGAEEESLRAYPHYTGEVPCVNASCDEKNLYQQFVELINNPDEMIKISERAIEFVRDNHRSSLIADLYLEVWKKIVSKMN